MPLWPTSSSSKADKPKKEKTSKPTVVIQMPRRPAKELGVSTFGSQQQQSSNQPDSLPTFTPELKLEPIAPAHEIHAKDFSMHTSSNISQISGHTLDLDRNKNNSAESYSSPLSHTSPSTLLTPSEEKLPGASTSAVATPAPTASTSTSSTSAHQPQPLQTPQTPAMTPSDQSYFPATTLVSASPTPMATAASSNSGHHPSQHQLPVSRERTKVKARNGRSIPQSNNSPMDRGGVVMATSTSGSGTGGATTTATTTASVGHDGCAGMSAADTRRTMAEWRALQLQLQQSEDINISLTLRRPIQQPAHQGLSLKIPSRPQTASPVSVNGPGGASTLTPVSAGSGGQQFVCHCWNPAATGEQQQQSQQAFGRHLHPHSWINGPPAAAAGATTVASSSTSATNSVYKNESTSNEYFLNRASGMYTPATASSKSPNTSQEIYGPASASSEHQASQTSLHAPSLFPNHHFQSRQQHQPGCPFASHILPSTTPTSTTANVSNVMASASASASVSSLVGGNNSDSQQANNSNAPYLHSHPSCTSLAGSTTSKASNSNPLRSLSNKLAATKRKFSLGQMTLTTTNLVDHRQHDVPPMSAVAVDNGTPTTPSSSVAFGAFGFGFGFGSSAGHVNESHGAGTSSNAAMSSTQSATSSAAFTSGSHCLATATALTINNSSNHPPPPPPPSSSSTTTITKSKSRLGLRLRDRKKSLCNSSRERELEYNYSSSYVRQEFASYNYERQIEDFQRAARIFKEQKAWTTAAAAASIAAEARAAVAAASAAAAASSSLMAAQKQQQQHQQQKKQASAGTSSHQEEVSSGEGEEENQQQKSRQHPKELSSALSTSNTRKPASRAEKTKSVSINSAVSSLRIPTIHESEDESINEEKDIAKDHPSRRPPEDLRRQLQKHRQKHEDNNIDSDISNRNSVVLSTGNLTDEININIINAHAAILQGQRSSLYDIYNTLNNSGSSRKEDEEYIDIVANAPTDVTSDLPPISPIALPPSSNPRRRSGQLGIHRNSTIIRHRSDKIAEGSYIGFNKILRTVSRSRSNRSSYSAAGVGGNGEAVLAGIETRECGAEEELSAEPTTTMTTATRISYSKSRPPLKLTLSRTTTGLSSSSFVGTSSRMHSFHQISNASNHKSHSNSNGSSKALTDSTFLELGQVGMGQGMDFGLASLGSSSALSFSPPSPLATNTTTSATIQSVSQQISARHRQHAQTAVNTGTSVAAANALNGSNIRFQNRSNVNSGHHSLSGSVGSGNISAPTAGDDGVPGLPSPHIEMSSLRKNTNNTMTFGASSPGFNRQSPPPQHTIGVSTMIDNSPIQVVRATVGTVDDPSLPCFTFRMWVLATIFTIAGAAISEYNYFRSSSAYFSIYFVQLASYFCGKAMAKWLPTRQFTIYYPRCRIRIWWKRRQLQQQHRNQVKLRTRQQRAAEVEAAAHQEASDFVFAAAAAVAATESVIHEDCGSDHGQESLSHSSHHQQPHHQFRPHQRYPSNGGHHFSNSFNHLPQHFRQHSQSGLSSHSSSHGSALGGGGAGGSGSAYDDMPLTPLPLLQEDGTTDIAAGPSGNGGGGGVSARGSGSSRPNWIKYKRRSMMNPQQVHPDGSAGESQLPATIDQELQLPPGELVTWGSFSFTLNDGKFNMKEHMLIGIAAAAGGSAAYATNILAIQNLVFNAPLTTLTGIGLVVSSQCIGFSMAGFLFDYVIKPSVMVWPAALVNVSLYNTLHEHKVLTRWFTRMQLFWYAFFAVFIYQWLPRMFMPVLSSMALLCWIKPSNNILRKLGSGYNGLGIGCISLDWSIISGVGPLYTPWWAQANFFIGLIGILWIVTPIVYFTNFWNASLYPIVSSNLYDNTSALYDISMILNRDLSFNLTMYENYSPALMTPYFAITYGTSFIAVIASFVHVALFYGADIKQIAEYSLERKKRLVKKWCSRTFGRQKHLRQQQGSKVGEENDIAPGLFEEPLPWQDERGQIPTEMFGCEDVHTNLMRAYPEVPSLWFAVLFATCFAMAIVVCQQSEIQLNVSALFLALVLAFVFAIPMAIIQALSSSQIGLNVLSEVVCGYILPGNQLANSVFKCYSYMALYQCLSLTQSFKLGHYMKVAPRKIFIMVLYGTLVGTAVNLKVLDWVLSYDRQDMFDGGTQNGWSFRNIDLFFSASLLWGAISPERLFGAAGSLYFFLPYCFVLGLLVPIPFYGLHRMFPPVGARTCRRVVADEDGHAEVGKEFDDHDDDGQCPIPFACTCTLSCSNSSCSASCQRIYRHPEFLQHQNEKQGNRKKIAQKYRPIEIQASSKLSTTEQQELQQQQQQESMSSASRWRLSWSLLGNLGRSSFNHSRYSTSSYGQGSAESRQSHRQHKQRTRQESKSREQLSPLGARDVVDSDKTLTGSDPNMNITSSSVSKASATRGQTFKHSRRLSDRAESLNKSKGKKPEGAKNDKSPYMPTTLSSSPSGGTTTTAAAAAAAATTSTTPSSRQTPFAKSYTNIYYPNYEFDEESATNNSNNGIRTFGSPVQPLQQARNNNNNNNNNNHSNIIHAQPQPFIMTNQEDLHVIDLDDGNPTNTTIPLSLRPSLSSSPPASPFSPHSLPPPSSPPLLLNDLNRSTNNLSTTTNNNNSNHNKSLPLTPPSTFHNINSNNTKTLLFIKHRHRSNSRLRRVPWHLFNTPLIFMGASFVPQAPASFVVSAGLVAFVFAFLVLRYRHEWWRRYTFVLAAALDSGTQICSMAVFVVFSLILKGGVVFPSWWGNDAINPELCGIGDGYN